MEIQNWFSQKYLVIIKCCFRLNQLNRFLTIDLIQTHRFDDIFMNALLTKNSLVAISDQTNDPLVSQIKIFSVKV